MKYICNVLVAILFSVQVFFAQNRGFEGVIETTTITQQDSNEQKILIANLKTLGWNEFAEDMLSDSFRTKIYIKGDSLWGESYLNDRNQIRQIYYQVGKNAFIIVPATGAKVPLGKTKEIENFLDSNTNENWREKINVKNWFKSDYDKWRRLKKKTKFIQGYECNLYRYDDETPNSIPSYYWIAEEIPVSVNQILPYFFEGKITPFGVVLEVEWVSKELSSLSIVRNLKLGPVNPILPRLQSINFGTLDSIQYADERMNQHLNGKTIENTLAISDFSFYLVGGSEPMNLYAKKGNGKFILLDIWATWCGPCIKDFPKLRQIQEENTAILDLISINIGDHRDDAVQEFIKKHNMSWAQIYGGRLLRAFLNPKKSIPYAILLDSDMKVRWMGNPSQHWEEIEKIIHSN